ncbi:MAG: hypothetical protein ABIP35_04415 [Ginsengibacter sp.]
MERKKKIELLQSLKDGTRPAKQVIEMLKGNLIEVDNFHEALMISSCPENCEGTEIIATGDLKKLFDSIDNSKNDNETLIP